MRHPALALLPLCLGCTASAGPTRGGGARSEAPAGFWQHWGDGKAELAGYALTMPRYGELRTGEAVLVTVTESFAAEGHVKSDRGGPGTSPVLKLNQVVDFQTGIYDYNTMTGTFLRLDGALPRGVPDRISFSMQEWCGQTSARVVAEGGDLVHTLDSYFEGESTGPDRLGLPEGALAEDALPGVLRGLSGPPPEGELRLLPRLMDGRLHHRPLGWRDGRLTRGDVRSLETPSGAWEVVPWTLEGGITGRRTWYIATEAPHLLVGWDGEDGEQARLSGHMRSAYWRQSGEGQEALRAELGLAERAR